MNLSYQPSSFTSPTGDPFADVGGYVIETLQEEPNLQDKDVLGLIEYAANIYISLWGANLYAFFLNSKITQPAFNSQRKLQETMDYYRGLVNETLPHIEGYCRISGQKGKLFPAGRDNHILSGSSTFVNFHHGFESGLYLSKEVIIRFFFVPLGVVQLGDKIGLLSSNNEIVAAYFVKQRLLGSDGHLAQIGRNLAEGVAKSASGIPSNALFGFADSCLKNLKPAIFSDLDGNVVSVKDTSLSLYHFTNFGAKPEVVLYQLSATVFRFYAECHTPNCADHWRRFVSSHYKNAKYRDAKYDPQSDTWASAKEEVGPETYSTWRNRILDFLLNGWSLIAYFKAWISRHEFPFAIVENYTLTIKNMDKRTLQKIKDVAGFIVGRDEDSIKKAILRLNRAKYVQEVRQYLLRLIDDNYKLNPTTPLIRLDDVEYLFPETVSWREIRDLVLIAVYEKLHDNNLKIETEFDDQLVETIDEEPQL